MSKPNLNPKILWQGYPFINLRQNIVSCWYWQFSFQTRLYGKYVSKTFFIMFTTHKMSITLYNCFDHMKLVRQALSKQSWNIIQKQTFIDLNRKIYSLLWTFLLSFVGHIVSYIFSNCQSNCSYVKGDKYYSNYLIHSWLS